MSFSNNNGNKDQHLSILNGQIDYMEMVKLIIQKKWEGLIAFETRNRITKDNITDLIQIYEKVKNES